MFVAFFGLASDDINSSAFAKHGRGIRKILEAGLEIRKPEKIRYCEILGGKLLKDVNIKPNIGARSIVTKVLSLVEQSNQYSHRFISFAINGSDKPYFTACQINSPVPIESPVFKENPDVNESLEKFCMSIQCSYTKLGPIVERDVFLNHVSDVIARKSINFFIFDVEEVSQPTEEIIGLLEFAADLGEIKCEIIRGNIEETPFSLNLEIIENHKKAIEKHFAQEEKAERL